MSNSEVENYEELCRLCASYDAIKMDIFSDKGKKRRLVDKITTCLPFEVSEDDLYPKSLCYRCIYNLETFYDFRRGCIAAKAKLETVIKRASEKTTFIKVVANEGGGKENEESIILTDDEQGPNPADFLEACLAESPHQSVIPKQDEEWGPFCCKTCGRVFNSRSALTIHAKFHQDNKNNGDVNREVFSCYVCEKVFSSKGHLALHSRVHIGETNSPILNTSRSSPAVKLYYCDLCSKSYSMAKHLWGHVSTCHKGDPLVTCGLCMRTFSSISNLQDHKKLKHKDDNIEQSKPPIENGPPPNEPIITLIADDSNEPKNLDENISSNKRKSTKPRKIERDTPEAPGDGDESQPIVQEGLMYSCHLCGERFDEPTKLTDHLHSIHAYDGPIDYDSIRDCGENEYVDSMMEAETVFCCEICIREFNDRASLWLHMLYSHREEASKACGICLKICDDTESLAQHIEACHLRNKTDQRRYSCQVCARQHDSRKKLVTHAKIHKLTDSLGNLVDPESVVVLNSDYYPPQELAQSGIAPMQIDENTFPSGCEICFKVFESEAKLSKHKRSAHKDNSSSSAGPYHLFFACELCGLSHLSRSERWRHMVTTHTGDPAVTCQQPECGKVFPTSAVKRDHEETHHAVQGQYPNTCEVCGKMWKTRVEYWKHMMGVHPDYLPFICGVCLKVFTELPSLVNHVRSIHWPLLGGDFCCDICGRPYSKVSKMSRHRKVHYVPTTCPEMRAILDNPKVEGVAGSLKVSTERHFLLTSDLPALCCDLCQNEEDRVEFANLEELGKHRFEKHNVMPCDLCPKYYGRTSHLWKHVNKIHKGHPDVTCPVCHRTSASKSHLTTHIAKYHKTSEDMLDCYVRGEDGVTTCSKCNKVFRKESLVRKHVKHCKGPRPLPSSSASSPAAVGTFTCERCSKSFNAENLLHKHMRNSHIMYKCEVCQVKTSSKADLYKHVKQEHPDDPNVKCAIRDCGQILRCKADLDRHVRDHRLSSQLHMCIFCAELVTSKFKLKRHLKTIHAQESKCLCFLCVKIFSTFEELRAHIVSAHTAALEKPNTCRICAKPCNNKSKMMKHIKYHGPTFHPCRICLKIFPSSIDLDSHINNHPSDSGDEEDLQIDETPLDPDSIMDIIGAPNDVKVKRNFDKETEENNESEPCSKKIKIEFPCDKCSAAFNSDNELSEHLQNVHKTSILEYVLSEGKSHIKQEKEADIDKNESRRENGAIMVKTESDTSFMHQLGLMPGTTEKNLAGPKLKVVRKVYINDDVPSKCEMCGKQWPAKRQLWQHLIRYHRAEASTCCGVCLKYCSSYVALSIHLATEHPDIFDGDGTNLSCKVCGKYHNARSKLLNHASVHSREEDRAQESFHSCLLCETSFQLFSQLASHMELEHKSEIVREKAKKPAKARNGTEKLPFYSCEVCSLVFASSIGLANHRRIHEHSDRFKCGQCGELCPSADSLATHKFQRHQGTEFVCAECKAQFTTYSQLTEHNKSCKAKGRQQTADAYNNSSNVVVVSVNEEEEEDDEVEEDGQDEEEEEADEAEETVDIDEGSKSKVGEENNGESSVDGEAEDEEEEEEEGDDAEDGDAAVDDGDEEVDIVEDGVEENETEAGEDETEVGEDETEVGDEEEEEEEDGDNVVEEETEDGEVEGDDDDDGADGDNEEVEIGDEREDEEDEVDDEEVKEMEIEVDEDEDDEAEVEDEDADDDGDDDDDDDDDDEGAVEDQKGLKAIEAYMCEDNMVEVVQVDLSDDGYSSKVHDI